MRIDARATPLAITFDWYGTLADHRGIGGGRGRRFVTYLASKGFEADPWDRRILHDVFDYYADAYWPKSSEGEKHTFWIEFTRRLFENTNTRCTSDEICVHSGTIREI